MAETTTAPLPDQQGPALSVEISVEISAEIPTGPEKVSVEEDAPAPAPRKTWALPKAPPKGSEQLAPSKDKKSLLEIMEEEKKKEEETLLAKQKQLEQRLLQEEEAALMQAMQSSMAGNNNDSTPEVDEDLKMALMLSMQDQPQNSNDAKLPPAAATSTAHAVAAAAVAPPAAAAAAPSQEENGLSEEEMKEIEKALMEADAAENAKTDAASLRLALELQNEEDGKVRATPSRGPQGNVRTMTRADFLREKGEGSDNDYYHDDEDDYVDEEESGGTEAGFRINSTKQSPWSRADGATIIGPNQEYRTKHDPKLQAQANAHRLHLHSDDGEHAHVGNKAYNAFHRSMQKKTVKGVAAHGHGRATADTDKTREGALDGRVRLQIARAVNNGLMDSFHGCVKEGKEALVFYASNSEGFDVAVKVFKRISEFRNRGEYVEGDPRYGDGQNFKHAGPRAQVELWAEKEHRNLVRAYRAHVPVPKPLWHKENVLFLRFLGEEGWPSPQLRELDIKKGSKKWTALYEQVMSAMQLLYCDARLVHGDLSEYNILVCPERFLERADDDDDENAAGADEGDDAESEQKPAAVADSKDAATVDKTTDDNENKKPSAVPEPATKTTDKDEEKKQPAQAVEATGDALAATLIDFGQAVDLRHPEANELLKRDVTRVKQFFDKKGITTVGVDAAMAYVQTKGAPLL